MTLILTTWSLLQLAAMEAEQLEAKSSSRPHLRQRRTVIRCSHLGYSMQSFGRTTKTLSQLFC